MGRVLGAGPTDASAFPKVNRELDIERDFDPRSDDLAIALDRVAVSDKEQRALGEDREEDGDPLFEAFIVHVAAMFRGGRRGDRLPAPGSNSEASEHRS